METNLPSPTTARVELLITQRVPHNFPGFQLFQTVQTGCLEENHLQWGYEPPNMRIKQSNLRVHQ